jgi:hypothetical protein
VGWRAFARPFEGAGIEAGDVWERKKNAFRPFVTRGLTILMALICLQTNLRAQTETHSQSISLGMSYSHEPKWGPVLPLADFNVQALLLANRSLGFRYTRSLPKRQFDLEFQYTFSGYSNYYRLSLAESPNHKIEEALLKMDQALYPRLSQHHQVAGLAAKEWPLTPGGKLSVGAAMGPLLRLGFDQRYWTYDRGTWVEGYFDRRFAIDLGLSGKTFVRWKPLDRLSFSLAGQVDQYLLVRRNSQHLRDVEVSRNTLHLGAFVAYHFRK